MAYRCTLNGQELCLIGSVITLYDNKGTKLRQWFYDSIAEAKAVYFACVGQALLSGNAFFIVQSVCLRKEIKMHEVILSDEITEYISADDFNKLVSVPNISENDIKFKTAPSLKTLLSEFGL